MNDISQKLERVLGSLVDYRIKVDLITISTGRNKLGQGAYGDVWLGEMSIESDITGEGGQVVTRAVAVKTLRQVMGSKEELTVTACQLARELKVWAGLKHRNILELVGFYLSDTLENAWLVSPYEPEGNLAEVLKKKKPDEQRKMELVFDALSGLRYLHSHRPTIVHGDLKPANIIVGLDGYAKLCDFGLAKALDEPTGLTTAGAVQGTPRYMSPELVEEENAVATLASDIWAFSCVAGEVLTGHAPYHPERAYPRIIMLIIKGKDPIPLDRYSLPAELETWIRTCWNPVAIERPPVLDCMNCLKRHMEAAFPASCRLFQDDDPSLVPSQTNDFFVELHREKLRKQSKDHPEYAETLTNLAFTLAERFEADGKLEDLDEAIALHREALDLRPVGHPKRQYSLRSLAVDLFNRSERVNDLQDLGDIVILSREALALCPLDHPDRSLNLTNLGAILAHSSIRSPKREVFDEIIFLIREALQLQPIGHPNHVTRLQNLAWTLRNRSKNFGDAQDLEEAIDLYRKTLDLCSVDHPARSANLAGLATSLSLTVKQLLDQSVSDECIKLRREALQLCPPGHSDHLARLRSLARELGARFETFGDAKDLDEAIGIRREILKLCPVGHSQHSQSIEGLAIPLLTRSTTYGDLKDTNEAIEFLREVLELCSVDHPNRLDGVDNLGWALCRRFELLGDDKDLEEAIVLLRAAANSCPAGHSSRPNIVLTFGRVLQSNFQRHRSTKDLFEAVELLREGIRLGDVGGDPVCDEALGTALAASYQNGGEEKDIEEAIELQRRSLQLRPGRHVFRYNSLLALGKSLHARGGTGDPEEVRRLYAEALELVHGDQPGNLRRQKLVGKLMDEMGLGVLKERPAVVENVAQQLEEVTLKDDTTKS